MSADRGFKLHESGVMELTRPRENMAGDEVTAIRLLLAHSDRVRACFIHDVTGCGFGKNHQHNFRLLNRLDALHELGLPLLTGLSRKRMIGEATGTETADQRGSGSVTGAVICALKGAKILRVHDVKQTAEAIRVLTATLREGNE